MKVALSYVAAGTNRFPQAADISRSCLASGSSNLVVLWNATDTQTGIFDTLPGHEGLVTAICFVDDHRLVSADDRGILCCWVKIGSQWTFGLQVQAHQHAISSLCFHRHLVTGSSDGSLKIWGIIAGQGFGELRQSQVISLGKTYPLSLAITTLPQSEALILVCGGTDRTIRVWTRSETLFEQSTILSGHEDWVRSLAFRAQTAQNTTLILASGSQDATIRLWKIEGVELDSTNVASGRLPDGDPLGDFEMSLNDISDESKSGCRVSLKRHLLVTKTEEKSHYFSVTFDALLVGHEAGITSLQWRPTRESATLLSASTDSSVILWSPSSVSGFKDPSSSIWIIRQRFGDIGGQRLGGFVGGLWAQDGREALAWGWGGGWRRWRCQTLADTIDENWIEVSAMTGHTGAINGIDWGPGGEYLISSGLDQTTRIHGPIRNADVDSPSWSELARPQVHGYNLHGVMFLDALKFVSIADEKVARVFEAPQTFLALVESLGIASFTREEHDRPLAANLPPLGLSNKAVDATSRQPDGSITATIRRPFEGDLAAGTLWPEVEKIFGHGYELVTLAVSKSRRLIATACKAATAEHATIRVYNTETWQLFGEPLTGHSLTVTRIAFCPNDKYILSVSRDRTWRLFEIRAIGEGCEPVAFDKSHARIIWDCDWSHDGDVFATASRDKMVKVWKASSEREPKKWNCITTIKVKEAATALSFSRMDEYTRQYLAVGLETGDILIYSNMRETPSRWTLCATLDPKLRHVAHVHRLAWRPGNKNGLQLASCSEDGTLRLFSIQETVGVK